MTNRETANAPTAPTVKRPAIAMDGLAWGMLLLLSLLWGGSFILQEYAVAELTAIPIVTVRVVLAALTLTTLLLVLGQPFPTGWKLWSRLLLLALLNNAIPFSLIVWGQSYTSAGLASVLNATTPLFAALFAHLLTSDERMAQRTIVGIGFGILGVALVIGPSVLDVSGAASSPGEAFGKVAVLGAAISYGIAAVFARSFAGTPAMTLATGQLIGSSTIMIPIALATGTPAALLAAGSTTWISLITLAVACTAFAYILYFRIIARAGATNAALVTILVPLSACTLDAILFGQQLAVSQLVGALVIIVSLTIIDGRVFARRATA